MPLARRAFLASASAMLATGAWARGAARRSPARAVERRDLFPEGVASGDPDASSVLLWTRYPAKGEQTWLRVEVAEDPGFERVIASVRTRIVAAADWTARILVGNLRAATIYWYRFIDDDGHASRTGRTITAPPADDPRPVRLAFVSCQMANCEYLHAYRRMIFEDERAPADGKLDFVLHLGDFVYELVWYPEDVPGGVLNGRTVRDLLRYPDGERIEPSSGPAFHKPVTLADYRTLWKAYLAEPDLQDARARWPFVAIWDNHEYSAWGWQGLQLFDGTSRPAQPSKLAAMQAWFEFQPARVVKASGPDATAFDPPPIATAPIARFDRHGFGDEPNNRLAVASLAGQRALRFGRHVELILTDNWGYRSEPPAGRPEAAKLSDPRFPLMVPEEAVAALDAGQADPGRPVQNPGKDQPPQTILGAAQKTWFIDRLRGSDATWKIWGNSQATLDTRFDPQNLPAELAQAWNGAGYAVSLGRDYASAPRERAEIYRAVRDSGVTGFVTLSGDRHGFWAGLAAPALPPRDFEPVGIAFVTASISSAGLAEGLEHRLAKDHPLRALYLRDVKDGELAEAVINLTNLHGVRAALDYARTGDVDQARALGNPDLAPHLAFLDHGGHGFATLLLTAEALVCEFVCIARPTEPDHHAEGPPVRYRVVHRAARWRAGEPPRLVQDIVEGDPKLSI